ncbi:protein kinase domain-containing protein [Ornithinimicrobium sp. W1679]|uniref:serine/threonine-protein kinase n=1 Tax=Ornithinimicrobium sp. W1679 TaxID=3418770 RepID=UPI003CF40FAF
MGEDSWEQPEDVGGGRPPGEGSSRAGAGADPGLPPTLPGYEVLAPLGAGATSSVWRARRRVDGLVVAVKVLRPAGGDVTAGLHEAGLLARVRHRHVVHLYDVLPLPDPATGRPAAVALATQLAGGGSLAQVLARRRILSAGELVTALQPVAGALADLHGTGVVHGDLSTGNVLFLRDGMPVLGDLGAARITGEEPGQHQGTGAAEGMVAPEVVEGFAPTPESDVYQLGALAWRCLAGEPPGPPYDRGKLPELAPDLPPGLTDLVLRCMAPDPEARPDAEEVALALLACATPEPVEVAPDADPAHGLTERLRSEARADLDAAPADGGRRGGGGSHRRRRGTGRGEAPAPGRPGRSPGSRGPGRWDPDRRDPGRVQQVVVPAVLVLASLLLIVAAVALVRPQLVEARSGTTDPAPASTGGPASAPAVDPASPPAATEDGHRPAGTSGSPGVLTPELPDGDGVEQRSAEATATTLPEQGPPEDELFDTLQVLLDGRGEAWERADDVLMLGIVAPDSPAEASETEQLARLRESGVRYPDVTFRVEDATLVPDGTLAREADVDAGTDAVTDRIAVRATVSRAALEGRDGRGGRLDPVPTSSERVRIELARIDERWLLWSWEPAPTG